VQRPVILTDRCFKIQVKITISVNITNHNSLLHLLSNFQNAITPQNMAGHCNNTLFNEFSPLYFHNERAERLWRRDVLCYGQLFSEHARRTHIIRYIMYDMCANILASNTFWSLRGA